MFRYVLFLAFAVGFASAATIMTTATCGQVTTVGTFSASCNVGAGAVIADAFILAPSFIDSRTPGGFDFGVETSAGGIGGASASAQFADDYIFTVFGGTGQEFFFPCFSGFGNGQGGGSFAGISFNGVSRMGTFNCPPGSPPYSPAVLKALLPDSKPFTFGVPQIVHIELNALSTSPGVDINANVFFQGPLLFDAAGNQPSNAYFTLVEVPEPSMSSLVLVGLIYLLAVPIRSMRHRGCYNIVLRS